MRHSGFYSHGVSYLHQRHAAVKIVLFGVIIAILPFVLSQWQTLLVLAVMLGGLLLAARVRRSQLLFFAPALPIIVISGLSWLFVDLGGAVVAELQLGPWAYTLRQNTLERSLTGALRALVWVLSFMVLLTTTSSRNLVAGCDRLGLPDRVSRAVAMTLRFWHTVLTDTDHVADAQRARGVDFERGAWWRQLIRRFLVTAVPTLFVMLKRFQTLNFALALRGLGAPGPKTRLYAPPVTGHDAAFLAVAGGVLGLVWLLDWWGGRL